jgi:VAD1 Analog of StAR-related lipid transfer domain
MFKSDVSFISSRLFTSFFGMFRDECYDFCVEQHRIRRPDLYDGAVINRMSTGRFPTLDGTPPMLEDAMSRNSLNSMKSPLSVVEPTPATSADVASPAPSLGALISNASNSVGFIPSNDMVDVASDVEDDDEFDETDILHLVSGVDFDGNKALKMKKSMLLESSSVNQSELSQTASAPALLSGTLSALKASRNQQSVGRDTDSSPEIEGEVVAVVDSADTAGAASAASVPIASGSSAVLQSPKANKGPLSPISSAASLTTPTIQSPNASSKAPFASSPNLKLHPVNHHRHHHHKPSKHGLTSPGGSLAASDLPRRGVAPHEPFPLDGTLPNIPDSYLERVQKMKLLVDVYLPVSPSNFLRCFILDDASCSIAEMHKQRGDSKITSTPWTEAVASSSSEFDSKPKGPEQTTEPPLVMRTLRLNMALEPMPFMPKETAVEKSQRLSRFQGPIFSVDTSARSFDVPYGDYFVTEDTWIITPASLKAPLSNLADSQETKDSLQAAKSILAKRGISDPKEIDANLCRLSVFVIISFSKNTVLKSKIIEKGEAGLKEFYRNFALPAMRKYLTKDPSFADDSSSAGANTNGSSSVLAETDVHEKMVIFPTVSKFVSLAQNEALGAYKSLYYAHSQALDELQSLKSIIAAKEAYVSPTYRFFNFMKLSESNFQLLCGIIVAFLFYHLYNAFQLNRFDRFFVFTTSPPSTHFHDLSSKELEDLAKKILPYLKNN